jgi:uncharacterized protein HemX
MVNKELTQTLILIGALIGIFILGFGIGGYWMWGKWNEADTQYQYELQNNQNMYEQQLKDLKYYNDSLNLKVKAINITIDSLNKSITSRNRAIDSLKRKYNEQINNINNMSHNELTNFFSNRY